LPNDRQTQEQVGDHQQQRHELAGWGPQELDGAVREGLLNCRYMYLCDGRHFPRKVKISRSTRSIGSHAVFLTAGGQGAGGPPKLPRVERQPFLASKAVIFGFDSCVLKIH
jgi:hypothetical protein